MALVVLGKENLDHLEAWARDCFNEVTVFHVLVERGPPAMMYSIDSVTHTKDGALHGLKSVPPPAV